MNSILKPRCLVVIDAKERTYARYDGNTFAVKAKSEGPLSAGEVEDFRVDPWNALGMVHPESAA